MSPGVFVVFEGIDGSGKSTLSAAVAERLALAGEPGAVERLREPTDRPGGQRIRELLRSGAELPQARWLELFLADRLENLNANVVPALSAGRLVVQDRYFYSTAAYQGTTSQGLSASEIVQLHLEKGCPEPDLVVFLELDVETALQRIAAGRGGERDVFETREFLERVRGNYHQCLPPQALQLDARQSPEELCARVHDRVLEITQ